MKTIATIILLISLYNIPFFQRIMTKQADKKYQREYYAEAIKIYSKIAAVNDSNAHVLSKLADSYRMVNDFKNAEKWYAKAVKFNDVNPSAYLYYAEMLKINEKYDSAMVWMEKYQSTDNEDVRPLRHIENKSYVELLKMDSTRIEIDFININSDFSDFGVSFINDKQVVFSSTRNGKTLLGRQNRRDNLPFFDMFIADVDNWQLTNVRLFSEELKSNLHDGPATFSKDGNEVYFTRNIYLKRSRYEERINRLMIYRSVKDSVKWGKVELLHFNSEEFSCGHPTLSADGQKLYFASDMPGGSGNTDIWVVERNGDSWGDPTNLGESINTPGREMFPYIHLDGTLYFSSDGYATLGGLDILACRPSESGFLLPVNLGYPINSPSDDFAFSLSSDGFNGYLSSNRKISASDDIYKFTIRPKPPIAVADKVETERYTKKVSILPISNDILGDGKVINITDFSNKSVNGGEVKFNSKKQEMEYFPPNEYFGLDTIFYTVCDTFTNYKGCSQSYIAIDVKNVYYGLEGLVVFKGTNQPVPDVEITLLDDHNKVITNDATSNLGSFKLDLIKNKKFTVKVFKDGYVSKNIPLSTIDIPPGTQKIKEVIEIEELKGLTFELMILFDLNKANIRPDAAKELDEKALTFLLENPKVRIELSAHTDSRGSNVNNKSLSQRRADSAVQYLISKGIDPKRMVSKGYGEEKLLNKCKDGVYCTEAEHQRNRRVEITVLSY
jgi:outer membrane protein OmpA-like peptidoglycan-associated protein/tetratricopeptide (TPR) repeat protein